MAFDGVAPLTTKRLKLEYTRDVVIPNIDMTQLDMRSWGQCLCGWMMRDERLNAKHEVEAHVFGFDLMELDHEERHELFAADAITDRQQLVDRVQRVLDNMEA